jgi:hypothetical protein
MNKIQTEFRFIFKDGQKVLQQRRWGYAVTSPWWKVWRADVELLSSEWEDIPTAGKEEKNT